MGKKGQITAFVIIGLVLLFSAGIYFYLQEKTTFFTPKELVPKELAPIQQLVEQCSKTLTEDAAFRASMQGGYVEIPEDVADDKSRYIDSGLKIPLWYTQGENIMPSLEDMQNDIANYVQLNLNSCVNNFSQFSQQYNIKELGQPEAQTVINDNAINTKITYPLEVTNKQSTEISKISQFSSETEDSFGRKYRLASQIFLYEQHTGILENLTMEIIASNGNKDFPNEGIGISCNKQEWSIKNSIMPNLKLALLANMRYLTISNTDTVQPSSPYPDYYSKFYKVKVSNEMFSGMTVMPLFDRDWNMDINVFPNDNGITRPATSDFPIIGGCFKIYNHKYDIVYPFVFRITDNTKQEPTYFLFGTDVVIDKSNANRVSKIMPEPLKNVITNSDYCNDTRDVITVNAIDENGNKVYNAEIQYQCIRFLCDMGVTNVTRNAQGYVIDPSDFALKTSYPDCAGGMIIAKKDGYVYGVMHDVYTGDVTINGVSQSYNGRIVNVVMTSLKNFTYDVKLVKFDEPTGSYSIQEGIPEGTSAVISLKNSDNDFEQTLIYPQDPEFPQNLQLIDSDTVYDVNINLVTDENEGWIGGLNMKWGPGMTNVQQNNKVTFYVLGPMDEPKDNADYGQMLDMINKESSNPAFQPVMGR